MHFKSSHMTILKVNFFIKNYFCIHGTSLHDTQESTNFERDLEASTDLKLRNPSLMKTIALFEAECLTAIGQVLLTSVTSFRDGKNTSLFRFVPPQ